MTRNTSADWKIDVGVEKMLNLCHEKLHRPDTAGLWYRKLRYTALAAIERVANHIHEPYREWLDYLAILADNDWSSTLRLRQGLLPIYLTPADVSSIEGHANCIQRGWNGAFAERALDTATDPVLAADHVTSCMRLCSHANNMSYERHVWYDRRQHADLVREVFGDPLAPPPEIYKAPLRAGEVLLPTTYGQTLLRYKDGAVRKLANSIHRDSDWGAMPVLADLLEDAGCLVAPALEHLRSRARVCESCGGAGWYDVVYGDNNHDTPTCAACVGSGFYPWHVRGCWVIDWLRGRHPFRRSA